jgi:hypothetical protein
VNKTIFVVKYYFRNESCVVPRSFPRSISKWYDDEQNILPHIAKTEEIGSVCDRKHNRCRTALNDDTLEGVRLSLLHSPCRSWRKLFHQENMCLSSAYHAVTLLHLRTYRILSTHELFSKGLWPLRSPDLSPPHYLCGVISKDMSATVILTPQRTWKRTSQRPLQA